MIELEKLLNAIKGIVDREKALQEAKRTRGENFNIFNILGFSTSEVRLHSAFISELLKPYGDHGLEEHFLISFINLVVKQIEDLKDFEFDVKSAKVTSEFDIGPISKDGTKGGRIDILLEDIKGQLIIIENKINAGDQPMQLLRYYNYAIDKKGFGSENINFCILYLTKEGNSPSNISLGIEDKDSVTPNEKANTKVKYECISYNKDIKNWLDECIRIAALYPSVRETIQQYKINLFQILNYMAKDNSDKMLEILTSSNNIETTIEILKKSSDIYKQVRQNFINELKAFIEKEGLRFEYDKGIVGPSNNCWIRITDENFKGVTFRIGVSKHTNDDGFRMDFITNPQIEDIEGLKQFWDQGYKPNNDNPVGWTYLWSPSGMQNSGRWWRWDDMNTIEDMIKGKMLDFFKKQIKDIKERKIFEELYDILNKQKA